MTNSSDHQGQSEGRSDDALDDWNRPRTQREKREEYWRQWLCYRNHLVRDPMRAVDYRIRLWHREIVNGSTAYWDDIEAQEYQWFLSLRVTNRWLSKANRRILKIPPHDAEGVYWARWQYAPEDDERCILTKDGVEYIRSQYRQDNKERREAFTSWGTFGFAAIAAAGAILSWL